MEPASKYKLLFAVGDHCEFAEVSVACKSSDSRDPEQSPTLLTREDEWAVPHAQNGVSAALKAFGINDGSLHVTAIRVTASDSTPDNIAVAAFIAAGLYAGAIDDPTTYIDHFIHDGRIRFPRSDDQLTKWLKASS